MSDSRSLERPFNTLSPGGTPASADTPLIVAFNHDHQRPAAQLRDILGGKGAYLAEMTSLGLPVPPGFTVSTRACAVWAESGDRSFIEDGFRAALASVETAAGKRFGDANDPLLLSVRSGAPASMPGMMDTILNVGLTPAGVLGLARASGSAEFAWDCYRRLAEMFAGSILASTADVAGMAHDIAATYSALEDRVAALDARLAETAPLPSDPWQQLMDACQTVVASWQSPRAKIYRQIENIPDWPCTAVNVQAMVFGNRGRTSGSGVAFTRSPSTGAPPIIGDWLANAQGEDVVAGTHAVGTMDDMAGDVPNAHAELLRAGDTLERHLGDMCDIEFTVEDNRLWLLQVRAGKRSPRAALRIAIDLAEDPAFALDRAGAVGRVAAILDNPPTDAPPLAQLLPGVSITPGIGASPGIGAGRACFDGDAVTRTIAAGDPAILVRRETSPEDVGAMAQAAGIITAFGGMMSHAAVVARGWGIPAVVGVGRLTIGGGLPATLDGAPLNEGDWLTVDGATGQIARERLSRSFPPLAEVQVLREWAQAIALPDPVTEDDALDPAAALVILAIKGLATPADMATALFASVDSVEATLAAWLAAGHVISAKRGFRLTETGLALAAAQIVVSTVDLHSEFDRINGAIKAAVTAWQVRNDAPNDHQDSNYDAGVLGTVAAIHAHAATWLAALAGAPLAPLFSRRLGRALDQLQGGDTRWLLSPRVDSYHSVWFELHEYLIRLAGKTRAEEAAAGRAQ